MKLIVGLGNPGAKYQNNRHNVGFAVVDQLQTEITKSKLQDPEKILIFKSQNLMNNSGKFVRKLVDRYQLDLADLWVIHDDLDLVLGTYKIQFGKGPKVHYGVKSIEEELGTPDFWRVRIGVENRPERTGKPSFTKATAGREYVLQDFKEEERKIVGEVINEICKKLLTVR